MLAETAGGSPKLLLFGKRPFSAYTPVSSIPVNAKAAAMLRWHPRAFRDCLAEYGRSFSGQKEQSQEESG
jgi:hypothetical protein